MKDRNDKVVALWEKCGHGDEIHPAITDRVLETFVPAHIAELEERITELRDTLENGIEYDEENNQYILVWTEREITQAKKEADEIMKALRGE